MSTLIQDLRFAARQLTKRPLLSGLAVLSVAVGIGLSLAVFTTAYAFLGPQGVVPDESSLLRLNTRVSHDDYLAVREHCGALVDLVATGRRLRALDWEEGAKIVIRAEMVSANYFSAFRLKPEAGRLFSDQDASGGGSVGRAVLSYRCWHERFGADPGLVGRTLSFGTRQLSVVGIAPRGFKGTAEFGGTDLWEALSPASLEGNRSPAQWELVGRVRANVPVKLGRAGLQTAVQVRAGTDTQTGRPRRPNVRLESEITTMRLGVISILTALAGLSLLVACTNVAALLAARFEERRSESALRLALGAGQWRIVRQLLTESFLLALIGAALGVLVTRWAIIAIQTALGPVIELTGIRPELRFDPRTLLVTVAAVVVATLVAGVMPALGASRSDLAPVLRATTTRVGRGRWRLTLRDTLVLVQLALSFAFMSTAGIFVLAAQAGNDTDRWAANDGLLVTSFAIESGSKNGSATYSVLTDLIDRARSVPGVSDSALTSIIPGAAAEKVSVYLSDAQALDAIGASAGSAAVQAAYFPMTGLGLLRGRLLTADDERHDANLAVVSASTARRFWPGAEPIGQLIRVGGPDAPAREVVGVVDDALILSSDNDPRPHRNPDPFLYVPYGPEEAQSPRQRLLLIRGSGDTRSLAAAVRHALQSRERDLVVLSMLTLHEATWFQRIPFELGSAFARTLGLFAAALAMVGLQGVIAHSVARRKAEIGTRMSLGATPNDIQRMIFRTALNLAALGALLGLPAAFAAVGIARAAIPGLPALNLGMLALVSTTVALTTLGASYYPARRAAQLDPMEALRCE